MKLFLGVSRVFQGTSRIISGVLRVHSEFPGYVILSYYMNSRFSSYL